MALGHWKPKFRRFSLEDKGRKGELRVPMRKQRGAEVPFLEKYKMK